MYGIFMCFYFRDKAGLNKALKNFKFGLRRASAALSRQRRLSLAELQPKQKGGK